ncbi:MAG: hypothetical protein Kow0075_10230 [Salibacteraceae bacterium]
MISALVIAAYFAKPFAEWPYYLASAEGDMAKNYFTFAYHVLHDQGLIWFQGMNYPWGEHLLYTDNQPLIANLIKPLSALLPTSELPTVLFLTLVAGVLMSAMFLFVLFRKSLKLNAWLSGIVALGVALLSPQLFRFFGHYSLAHCWIIPAFILFLHRQWKEGFSYPSMLYAALMALASAFIHPYFLVMLTFFWLGFILASGIAGAGHGGAVRTAKLLVIVLLPLLAFRFIMYLTDPVPDRPDSPYGFLQYTATLRSLFIPYDLYPKSWFAGLGKNSGEGSHFVGSASILLSIYFLIYLAIPKLRTGSISWEEHSAFTISVFLGSLPVLVYATGFPFTIEGLEKYTFILGPFRQFRGVVRFSFVFYYAAGLMAAAAIGHLLSKPSVLRTVVALGAVALLWAEVALRHQSLWGNDMDRSRLREHRWTEASVSLSNQHQALLPTPYFHAGSEAFRMPEQPKLMRAAFDFGLTTGLPIAAVYASRTSLSQTRSWFDFILHANDPPNVLNVLDKRPLLMMVDTSQVLSPHANDMLAKSHYRHCENGVCFYSFYPDSVVHIVERNKRQASSIAKTAILLDGPMHSDSLHYESFDTADTPGYSGGCALVNMMDWTPLIPENFEPVPDQEYVLSIWVKTEPHSALTTQLWLWQYDHNDNELSFSFYEISDLLWCVDGEWAMVILNFTAHSQATKVAAMLHREYAMKTIYVDEVLLLKKGMVVNKPDSLNLNTIYYR